MIGTYKIREEQAERIPWFYFPRVSENDLPEGLKIKERYDERLTPMIICSIGNAICSLTLYHDKPLIDYLNIYSENSEDFNKAKKRLEDIFKFRLEGIIG